MQGEQYSIMQIARSGNFPGCQVLINFTGKLLQLYHSHHTLLTSYMKYLQENFCAPPKVAQCANQHIAYILT